MRTQVISSFFIVAAISLAGIIALVLYCQGQISLYRTRLLVPHATELRAIEGVEVDSRAPRVWIYEQVDERECDVAIELLAATKGPKYLFVFTSEISDAALLRIGDLTNLESLHISERSVTVKFLDRLTELERLEYLDISGDAIDDHTVEQIARLKMVSFLAIRSNELSDAGLLKLKNLPELNVLDVRSRSITAEAIESLFRSHGKINLVVWGMGDDAGAKWFRREEVVGRIQKHP